MVLSDIEIQTLVDSKQMIGRFDVDRLQAASYDVGLFDKLYEMVAAPSVIDLSNPPEDTSHLVKAHSTDGFVLAPGSTVLVELQEYLRMPADITAHLRPRTTFMRLGLRISQQHINPGYEGRLTIQLSNQSKSSFKLCSGLIVGQLVFEKLKSMPSADRLYDHKEDAKYHREQGFTPPKLSEDALRWAGNTLSRL